MSALIPKGRMQTYHRNKYNFTEGPIKQELVCLYFLIRRYLYSLASIRTKLS